MPSQLRILLTGAGGQVGGDLLPLLEPHATVIAPRRSQLNLGEAEAVRRFIMETKPDWIINPAAYTAVDKAESEPEAAYAINAEAPRVIGETATQLGIPVVHFSTDYVYNGQGTKAWVESDETAPLSTYGASKLAGDKALAGSGAAHIIFRTSWVYGTRGRNFLLTMLRLGREKEELRVVDDQHGSPTWSRDLASLVVHVVRRIGLQCAATGESVENAVRTVQGVYHAANAGGTTWCGFAGEIFRLAAQAHPGLKFARLVPIASSEYPTPAKRPLNSRLNCSKLANVFKLKMPAWEESAAAVVRKVLMD